MTRKWTITLITALLGLYLYHSDTDANSAQQCFVGIPQHDQNLISENNDSLPIDISSNESNTYYPNQSIFTGNVTIKQGKHTLKADKVILTQRIPKFDNNSTKDVIAVGNVKYLDNLIEIQGVSAWNNLNNKDSKIWDAQYFFVGRQGRGQAKLIETREKNRYTILTNGIFTSCPLKNNSWTISGSKIVQDRQEQVVKIWDAVFRIGSLPVLYSPYFQLPIGDKRRSGFLHPNIKYSTINGIEFFFPLYWNISPQTDATITPHYMSNRGLQLSNEFRYLSTVGSGLIEVDFIHDNLIDTDDKKKPLSDQSSKRWLFHWQHDSIINQVWKFSSDYTKVSDPHYFTDLSSAYGSSTDSYATQNFELSYNQKNWNAQLSTTKFQIFSDIDNAGSYRTEPKLDLNYHQRNNRFLYFQVNGQIVRFVNTDKNKPAAERIHLSPSITFPLSNQAGHLNTEVNFQLTHYQQSIPSHSSEFSHLKDSVTRVLPELKIDGSVFLERSLNSKREHIQTLEPRIQYLYIPYHDQSDIYIYDSTLLQADYLGLFRAGSYSGLDRIASANQIATGLTSRFFEQNSKEYLNFSIGQIYYFKPSRIGDENIKVDQSERTGSLVWAGESYWKINNSLIARDSLQYDPRLDSIVLGNLSTEYRKNNDTIFQLNYRYAGSNYITAMVPSYQEYKQYSDGISQVGVVVGTLLSDKWIGTANYYYDTHTSATANSQFNLQYKNCCWSVGLSIERRIHAWNSREQRSIYDNRISINFALTGLGENDTLSMDKLLQNSVLPYQQIF